PAVTGEEPLRDVIARLAGVQDPQAQQLECALSDVERALRALDRNGIGTTPAQFRELLPRLSTSGKLSDGDRVFQIDLFKPAPQAALAPRIMERIRDAALLLNRLMPSAQPDSLVRFRDAFRERFEGCEVPLLEALDPDVGIGFEVDDL